MKFKESVTYDDLLLVPQYSDIESREEVDISSFLGYHELKLPILASPMDTVSGYEMAMAMSQAGGMARYGFAGLFWKAVPKDRWPEDEDYLASIHKNWQEPFGDMRQELVFIGQNLDARTITEALDKQIVL